MGGGWTEKLYSLPYSPPKVKKNNNNNNNKTNKEKNKGKGKFRYKRKKHFQIKFSPRIGELFEL